MSLANVLVPNNLPIRGGSGSSDLLETLTTGYPVVAYPGTQVNALVLLTSQDNVPAGDYLVEYRTSINCSATTPTEDLGVETYTTVERGATNQVISIGKTLRHASNNLAPQQKTVRQTISGSVTVRLTAPAKINLYLAPSTLNDVSDAEIFGAPRFGLTISKVQALGNFLTV